MPIYANNNGFTFIELMVSIVISMLVMAGLYALFRSGNEIYVSQEQIVDVRQNIRAALTMVTRDIRMAGFDPARNASCAGIDSANATSLHVRYDYDGNGLCDDLSDWDYRYDQQGSAFVAGIPEEDDLQTLVDTISFMEFAYTLSDGSTTANPSDASMIRMVSIHVCGKILGAYSGKYDMPICYNATVRCRNMGLE